MSYTIQLVDSKTRQVLELNYEFKPWYTKHDEREPCILSITYNYSEYYRMAFNDPLGIRCLYGISGKESIPLLEMAISKLPNNTDPNYWAATGGNAKRPLKRLLKMAKQRLEGIWDGD